MNTTKPCEPRPALDEDSLYIGDNGRVFCGRLPCPGMSAYYSGRTISGQRVDRLSAGDIRAWIAATGDAPECEGCGRRGGRA
jgi:hypothetical protein